jgi:molybdopterin molybdotransferase
VTDLVPLEDAQALVLRTCLPFHPRTVPLAAALGCVTTAPLRAGEAVPPFDNSAMDGYAVRAADTGEAPRTLEVVGTIAAGAASEVEVHPGQAVRIMTGAPLPPGADAVVMVEHTRPSDDGSTVTVERRVERGTAVRRAAEDIRPGTVVLEAGSLVTPGRVGVIASVGLERVPVRRRPIVGVLSTGDELVDGSRPLEPGRIRDSNRPTLLAMAADASCEAVDLGVVRDDEEEIAAALLRGIASCDVLVTSGGVSVGDFDFVKVVLDRLGEMRWMQVAIKPAKPFAFGLLQGKPVFGLPGNPVSSMVSFELFARPGLRQMMGHPPDRLLRRPVAALAEHDLERVPDGKTHFVRVIARVQSDGRFHVRSAGAQGSHQMTAMAAANALAVLPDGRGVVAGGEVSTILLSGDVQGP